MQTFIDPSVTDRFAASPKSMRLDDLQELVVVKSGSVGYGLQTEETKDLDVRSVFGIPKTRIVENFLSFSAPKEHPVYNFFSEDRTYDYNYTELRTFVRNLAKGSFTACEVLFAPGANVIHSHHTWRELFGDRRRSNLVNRDGLRSSAIGILHQAKKGLLCDDWKSAAMGLRVAFSARRFFTTDGEFYPVDLRHCPDARQRIMDIRMAIVSHEAVMRDIDENLKYFLDLDFPEFNPIRSDFVIRSYYRDILNAKIDE
jgi:hypothetical protein